MPKMKTDKGAAKRVKVTGTGRLRRRKQNRSHIFEKKTSVRTRRLARETDFSPGDERSVSACSGSEPEPGRWPGRRPRPDRR